MSEPSQDLLNIYEVEDPHGPRFLVCFLEPELAKSKGFESCAVVGEFTPREDGEFDPHTFTLNPDFIETFIAFMNAEAIRSADLQAQARANPSGWLYLVDPRNSEPLNEPPPTDLLGGFAIDDQGVPVPDSFRYNEQHRLFDPDAGPSAILMDRQFYDWMHTPATL